MMRYLPLGLLLTICFCSPVNAAHSIFKRALQEHYKYRSVSCTTCHVDGEERTERNSLGTVFEERMSDLRLTERFAAARRRGSVARQEFETVMRREFLDVLKEIEPLTTDSGETYRERFRAGRFEGIRLR